jgi:uncharacterized membrane-anchored protein
MTRWRALIALGLALVLLTASAAVWRFEAVIRGGRLVYIPLLPVDPRAPLLGDYMTLNYGLGEAVQCPFASTECRAGMGWLTLDARGVASALSPTAIPNGQPLRYHFRERRIVYGLGQAYFFAEGQGAALQSARFAAFRVTDDGRAVLVGLNDANLHPLEDHESQ